MRKELDFLQDIMDGLENLVQDRFQATNLVDIKEFKSQLAKMRTRAAKLDEKIIYEPTPIMLDCLMKMLNNGPCTQSIDDVWCELPKSKSGKWKHKFGEFNEELPADLSKEERRQEKKSH